MNPGLRLLDTDEDVGYLALYPDRLLYVGDRYTLTLPREQILSVERQAVPAATRTSPRRLSGFVGSRLALVLLRFLMGGPRILFPLDLKVRLEASKDSAADADS